MTNSYTAENLETLAAEIGQNVFIDVAKWHLLLSDAHLHTVLAEKFYPMLQSGSVDEDQVTQVLAEIPVKLGGGKREVPLLDLLPMQCQVTLMDILEEFQKNV